MRQLQKKKVNFLHLGKKYMNQMKGNLNEQKNLPNEQMNP